MFRIWIRVNHHQAFVTEVCALSAMGPARLKNPAPFEPPFQIALARQEKKGESEGKIYDKKLRAFKPI
jgi:hypothetical protein